MSLSIFIGVETEFKRLSKFPSSQLVSGWISVQVKVFTLSLVWNLVVKTSRLWVPITWGDIFASLLARFLVFDEFLNSPEPQVSHLKSRNNNNHNTHLVWLGGWNEMMQVKSVFCFSVYREGCVLMYVSEILWLKDDGMCLPDMWIKKFLSGCPGSSRSSQEKEDMAISA